MAIASFRALRLVNCEPLARAASSAHSHSGVLGLTHPARSPDRSDDSRPVHCGSKPGLRRSRLWHRAVDHTRSSHGQNGSRFVPLTPNKLLACASSDAERSKPVILSPPKQHEPALLHRTRTIAGPSASTSAHRSCSQACVCPELHFTGESGLAFKSLPTVHLRRTVRCPSRVLLRQYQCTLGDESRVPISENALAGRVLVQSCGVILRLPHSFICL